MKTTIKLIAIALGTTLFVTSCDKNDDPAPGPTTYYQTQDQKGRPAINTVFNVSGADKDAFNVATPATMNAAFQAKFQARLLALNPGYTVNALKDGSGMNIFTASVFTGVLATDVLNVSTTGATQFFTSPTVYLTGRGLADDVIDNELTLIFGGPTGGSNPGLISDNVGANDKAFLASFPYMAAPF